MTLYNRYCCYHPHSTDEGNQAEIGWNHQLVAQPESDTKTLCFVLLWIFSGLGAISPSNSPKLLKWLSDA